MIQIPSSNEDSGASESGFDQVAVGLTAKALQLGASAAAVIAVDRIVIEEGLASLCRKPRCENFGLSASCPPHVQGPAKFREWMQASTGAVFFKIEVPSSSLFSDDRREIMGLLHDIAAQIEQHAIEIGYANSKAFAGGSCKMIFCRERSNCAALANEKCRNPAIARPSMSGFGVNVGKLIEASWWGKGGLQSGGAGKHGSFAALYGLVLIG
jgi:predicted metal-binding protein